MIIRLSRAAADAEAQALRAARQRRRGALRIAMPSGLQAAAAQSRRDARRRAAALVAAQHPRSATRTTMRARPTTNPPLTEAQRTAITAGYRRWLIEDLEAEAVEAGATLRGALDGLANIVRPERLAMRALHARVHGDAP